MNSIRPLVFAAVTIAHIALILFVSFRVEAPARNPEPVAGVMRLVDVRAEIPPPPPPSPPPLPQAPPPLPTESPPEASSVSTLNEAPIAETIIEIENTEIESGEISPPVTTPASAPLHAFTTQNEYLPRHSVSTLPVLPEEQIARAIVYPRNARRSNIEGIVILELFIDRQGAITDVRVLRENPPNRGFGQAAVNAFRGIRALKPAELNGEPVAVRFQYNLRFTLR